MRIVVNTIPLLSPLTGIGKYTWQICRAMENVAGENEYAYYYGYYSPHLFCSSGGKASVSKAKDFIKNIPLLGRSLRLLKGAGALLTRRDFDVYFEPNYIPLRIPTKKTVVAVPDLSPFLHPEWHRRETVEYFRSHFFKNIARADQIITISDFIRDAAIGEFGFSEDRVTTVPLGYAPECFFPQERTTLGTFRKKYLLPERFVLYVGSIEPRKNLVRLLKAYRQLPSVLRNEVKLVLAGFSGWDNAEVMSLLNVLKEDVAYLGYVPEEDLASLYCLAEFFVYPALYEGFGLPPLEAMACGCPVLVSNVASLPEVCGDAAIYVNPLDVNDLSTQMSRLLTNKNLKTALKQASLVQASRFSWKKSASEHLRVFSKLY